jgi:hypothetical protein
VAEVEEKDVSGVSSIEVRLSEHTVVESNSGWFVDEPGDAELGDLGSIEDSLPLLLGEVGRDGEHCSLVLEIVLLEDQSKLVEVGSEDLLGEEGLSGTLVFDFEGNAIILIHTFGRAEFFLGSEHWVVGSESEESVRVGDGVFEVGFHFDISSFTNIPLVCSIADNDGGLSEVSLISDDLDSSSLGYGHFARPGTKIDTDRGTDLLIAH